MAHTDSEKTDKSLNNKKKIHRKANTKMCCDKKQKLTAKQIIIYTIQT